MQRASAPTDSQMDLTPDIERQASQSFRGYAYQAYRTIFAWLNCRADEEIRCEFAEDIAIVKRDAAGEITAAELDQVKHSSPHVTLNSSHCTKLINNFFRHTHVNPGIRVSMRLCTIADRGRESGIEWIDADCGIDVWEGVQRGTLPTTALDSLRKFLKDNESLSPEARLFAERSDNAILKELLIDRIFWDTGLQDYAEIQDAIVRHLSERSRPITDPTEVEAAVNRLWRDVTDRMATQFSRPLTKADLDESLRKETTFSADRNLVRTQAQDIAAIKGELQTFATFAQRMTKVMSASGGMIPFGTEPSGLNTCPPLPELCAQRSELVQVLRNRLSAADLLWIHGWTGAGKSTLAALLLGTRVAQVLWRSLRGVGDFSLNAALRAFMEEASGFVANSVVVFDDFPECGQNTEAAALLDRIVHTLSSYKVKIVVTSQVSPPSRLGLGLGTALFSIEVPVLELDEVSNLLVLAGLGDSEQREVWATFIHTTTRGHPQLAAAYIQNAKAKSWDFSARVILSVPTTAEQVKAEARKLLALSSDGVRELARRLSVVPTNFTRDFALELGSAPQPLQEPGTAFDSLVGPWIQPLGNSRFVLSPLLEGYASANTSPTVLNEYYKKASYAWLQQRTIQISQAAAIAFSAILASDDALLARLTVSLTHLPQKEFSRAAKWLEPICFLQSFPLKENNASKSGLFVFFRYLQLRVAESTKNWSQFTILDRIATEEIDQITDTPIQNVFRLFQYVYSLTMLSSPLSARMRLERAFAAVGLIKSESLPDWILGTNLLKAHLEAFGLIAFSAVDNIHDLEYLISRLSSEAKQTADLMIGSLTDNPDIYAVVIDSLYRNFGADAAPDWQRCLSVFQSVAEIALRDGNRWLYAAAGRGRMLVSDEALGDASGALQVSADARSNGMSHPLLDITEAMVLFRQGRHGESLKALAEAEDQLPLKLLTVQRLFALGRGINSAFLLECATAVKRIEDLANRGRLVADHALEVPFARVAKIAFSAEKAWIYSQKKMYDKAVEEFVRVIRQLQVFADQNFSLFHMLRLRIGHTLLWLSREGFGQTASGEPLAKPVSGVFANFEDPPDLAISRDGTPYEMMWASLASYAAQTGQTVAARRLAALATKADEGVRFFMANFVANDALFLCDLLEGRFDQALVTGLQQALLNSWARGFPSQERLLRERMPIPEGWKDIDPTTLENWRQTIPRGVIVTIFAAFALSNFPDPLKRDKWTRSVADVLGSSAAFDRVLDWFDAGAKAVDSDEEALKKCSGGAEDVSGIDPDSRFIAVLALSASKGVAPPELIRFQEFALRKISSIPGTALSSSVCRLIARRWMWAVKEQPFIFRDRLSREAVHTAALPEVFGVSECAQLLLIAADAVHVNLPEEMLSNLKHLSRN